MWEHQRRYLQESAHLREYALWWEPRTGKTRVLLDTAAYQFEAGRISALTVGAYPSNVHRNWSINEIPAYLPRRIPRMVVTWNSPKASSAAFQEELQALLTFKGLAILTFNCEALTQSRYLWPYLQKLMHRRPTMAVADESAWSATPNAARAKRAEAWARRAVVRRIADGTPVDESPFDAFAQCNLLRRGILGHTKASSFRAFYGDYEMAVDEDGNQVIDTETGLPLRARRTNHATGSTYEVLRGYRNLEDLNRRLLSFGSRVLRADCADLPQKIYKKVHFDLDATTRRAYDELKAEYRTEIGGREAQASHQLARLGRLTMVARGYWPEEKMGRPCPDCGGSGGTDGSCDRCDGLGVVIETVPRRLTSHRNEAIVALKGELEAMSGPGIIWAWHHWDVADCLDAVRSLGRRPVRYDGSVRQADRAANLSAFQGGKADIFVATQDAAGRGIPLHVAGWMIYYNNAPSQRKRRQSEDRAEGADPRFYREGRGTLVTDIIARNTIDEHWVDLLRSKRSIAERVMGDRISEWLA